MISAGSEIPKIGDACDCPGTGGTRFWRRWLSPALVLLPCLLVQGCGNSQTKTVANSDPASPRSASAKGDILVPRAAAGGSQPSARDSFSDRYAGDSFADRYSAAHSFAPASTRVTAGFVSLDMTFATEIVWPASSNFLPGFSATRSASLM